jgi:hypothetical protein
MFEFYFFVYSILVPLMFVGLPIALVTISFIKKGNPERKPFINQDDFFRQVLSLTGLYFWSLFFWGVFYSIINNTSLEFNPTNIQWGLFLNVVTLAIFAYFQETYMSIATWIAIAFNYIVGQMIYWSISDISSPELGTKTAYTLFTGWLLLFLIYILGHKLTLINKWYRLGISLRILAIIGVFLGLLVLSLSEVSKYIWVIFKGIEFQSPAVYILTITTIVVTIATLTYTFTKDSFKLEKWELSVLPTIPLLFLIATPFIMINNLDKGSDVANFVWFAGFTILTIGFNFYLFIRSQISNELWLKVVAVVLVVITMLVKLFDNFGGLTQKGTFFLLMGGFFFGLLLVRNKFKREELKLN